MVNSDDRRKRIPSQIFDRYWLLHFDENYKYKNSELGKDSGKWLIFDSIERVDDLWIKIMNCLDTGLLGPEAKVSTSKFKPGFENRSNQRVICVYTESFQDKKDIWRIEKAIRDLGFWGDLYYKLDTDAGKYEKDGYNNVVKLISPAKKDLSGV